MKPPTKKISIGELAGLVTGQVVGDAAIEVVNAAILRDARAGDITFVNDRRLADELAASNASAVVVSEDINVGGMPSIVVANVQASFTNIVSYFRPRAPEYASGISPAAHVPESAVVAASATILPGVTLGERVTIGARTVLHPGTVIMEATTIGEDCVVFPNVVIYENVKIGNRCILHGGCVIGAYGFGYDTSHGKHHLSAQLGNVILEDFVEIGAGSTVDRGTYGPTLVGEGTKVDDQVMIAHNCRIGKHNLLCSQVGIAGSTTTGDYVVMGGQAGVRDHIHVGMAAQIGAQAGVASDVPDGVLYTGSPAIEHRRQRTIVGLTFRLPEMRRELRRLTKVVENMTSNKSKRDAA
jgi:UDP-3-O-[3-hydroxymyristoyl] glucosamine N-acyltransferase